MLAECTAKHRTGRRWSDLEAGALVRPYRQAALFEHPLADLEHVLLHLGVGVAEGERVSVHPLGVVRFKRSFGLKYPLDGLKMVLGERTGTSNEATSGLFRIEVEPRSRAPWLLILQKSNLLRLVAALMQEPEAKADEDEGD